MSGGDSHAAKHKEKRDKKNRKKRAHDAELAAKRTYFNGMNGFAAADAAVKRTVAQEAQEGGKGLEHERMKAEYVEDKRAAYKAKKAKKRFAGTGTVKKEGEADAKEREKENVEDEEDAEFAEDDDLERAMLEELAKA
jgi:hypothetical protein